MCFFINCFSWMLDLLHGCIMYVLSCVAGLVVCTGFVVAVILGVAYGYNYAMAEFFALSRTDINVYMRRGQFLDDPHFGPKTRRSGGGEVDMGDSEPEKLRSDERQAAENDQQDAIQLTDQWNKRDEGRRYLDKITNKPLAVSLYTYIDESEKMSTDSMAVLPVHRAHDESVEVITISPIHESNKEYYTKANEKIFAQTYRNIEEHKDSGFLNAAADWVNMRPTVTPQVMPVSLEITTQRPTRYYKSGERSHEERDIKDEGLRVQPLGIRTEDFVSVTEQNEDDATFLLERRKTQTRPRKPSKRRKYYKNRYSKTPYIPTVSYDNPEDY